LSDVAYSIYPDFSKLYIDAITTRYYTYMHSLSSRSQFELFAAAFLACLLVIWFTMIVKKDFIFFTDPETVPESTEVIPNLLGISDVDTEE